MCKERWIHLSYLKDMSCQAGFCRRHTFEFMRGISVASASPYHSSITLALLSLFRPRRRIESCSLAVGKAGSGALGDRPSDIRGNMAGTRGELSFQFQATTVADHRPTTLCDPMLSLLSVVVGFRCPLSLCCIFLMFGDRANIPIVQGPGRPGAIVCPPKSCPQDLVCLPEFQA